METQNYSYLLGFIPGLMFLAMIFFAAIGVFIRMLLDATERDKTSTATPVRFSFWFLIKDNWKTILLAVIMVLITLRFAASVFEDQFSLDALAEPAGKEKWLFGSLVIGVFYSSVTQALKEKFSFWKVRKE